MCRIYLGKERSYKGSMKHGGIQTRKAVYRGLELIHEHLPIQSSKLDHSIVSSTKVKILYNGELFDRFIKNDLYFLQELADEFINIETFIDDVKNIDGFYSFIIIDLRRDLIYTFTDPLGKKQLYYKQGQGIASEIRPFKSTLNEKVLTDIVKWGYITSDETVKNDVYRIKPNKLYTFDMRMNLNSIGENYYDFSADPEIISLYDAIDLAVKNRLRGNCEVSMLLSGGIDSSIIYHHASKYSNLKSYCVDNGDDLFFAKVMDREVNEIKISFSPETLTAMESPVDLGSLFSQYSLCENVPSTVILTGDGADEVFGGYNRQLTYDAQLSDVFTEIPYYHNPRLDRMSMWFTKEIRSPFLSLEVVKHGLGLEYERRKRKVELRETYRGILPDGIIDRKKEPLKIDSVRNENQIKYRQGLVDEFRRNFS